MLGSSYHSTAEDIIFSLKEDIFSDMLAKIC